MERSLFVFPLRRQNELFPSMRAYCHPPGSADAGLPRQLTPEMHRIARLYRVAPSSSIQAASGGTQIDPAWHALTISPYDGEPPELLGPFTFLFFFQRGDEKVKGHQAMPTCTFPIPLLDRSRLGSDSLHLFFRTF